MFGAKNRNTEFEPEEKEKIIAFLKRSGRWPKVSGFQRESLRPPNCCHGVANPFESLAVAGDVAIDQAARIKHGCLWCDGSVSVRYKSAMGGGAVGGYLELAAHIVY